MRREPGGGHVGGYATMLAGARSRLLAARALAAGVGAFYLAVGGTVLADPDAVFGAGQGWQGVQHYVRDAAVAQLALGAIALFAACRSAVLRPLMCAVTGVSAAVLAVHGLDNRRSDYGDVPALSIVAALGAAAAALPVWAAGRADVFARAYRSEGKRL